ncbi:hypothetical protein ACFL6N_06625 [Thermodesulfobacteriota bacterium]
MPLTITKSLTICILLVVSESLLLQSCGVKHPDSPAASDKVHIQSISVLPTETPLDSSQQKSTSPQDQERARQLTISAEKMDRIVADYFQDAPSVTVVSKGKMASLQGDMTVNRQSRAQQLRDQLNSDAILFMTLYRYTERAGGNYSSARPASYELIMTETGETLCRGSFFETQQSLMDNLFTFPAAIRRGFKWISTEELIKEGVNSKFSACTHLKH